MKKARKGFTLVELLIVVAILATLTAAMTVSMSGSTAKAKAAQIVANVDSCKTAAMLYYANHLEDTGLSSVTAEAALQESIAEEVVTDFKANTQAINYTASGSGPDNWILTVDFKNDADATDIATALKKVKGYSKAAADKPLVITLLTGKVEAGS